MNYGRETGSVRQLDTSKTSTYANSNLRPSSPHLTGRWILGSLLWKHGYNVHLAAREKKHIEEVIDDSFKQHKIKSEGEVSMINVRWNR